MLRTYIFTFWALCFWIPSMSQSNGIKGEMFLVADEMQCVVTIVGDSKYEVSEFPDIRFLEKDSRSIKHSSIAINGKKEMQHVVTQIYHVGQTNRVQIPSFEIEVNGRPIIFEAKTFLIQADVSPSPDIEEVELIMETDKKSVFINEGVNVVLKLYISDNTTTQFVFPDDLSEQVEKIAKALKSKDCLESRLIISNITASKETRNRKNYNVYKLLETNYFPLNVSPIQLNTQSIKMEKNKGDKVSDVIFRSKPLKISVKDLPSHPLKETVPVGEFSMREVVKGGKNRSIAVPFDYQVTIDGNTDMKNVNIELPQNYGTYDAFLSNAESTQLPGETSGRKTFNFKIIPKSLGTLFLRDQIKFIFFNTAKAQYDTIFAKKSFNIIGEKIEIETGEDIFSNIYDLKTSGFYVNKRALFSIGSNLIWLLITGAFIFLTFKKQK